jgi:hypothetical protein
LRPYLKKPQHTHTHKIWLVEWLKVLALSSNPSTAKINSLRAFGVPDFSPREEGGNEQRPRVFLRPFQPWVLWTHGFPEGEDSVMSR